MQDNVTEKGPHQVLAPTGVQQRHIQYHKINTFLLREDAPLFQDFAIISPQTVDALDVEQIVFFSFRSSRLYWGRSKSLPDCLSIKICLLETPTSPKAMTWRSSFCFLVLTRI